MLEKIKDYLKAEWNILGIVFLIYVAVILIMNDIPAAGGLVGETVFGVVYFAFSFLVLGVRIPERCRWNSPDNKTISALITGSAAILVIVAAFLIGLYKNRIEIFDKANEFVSNASTSMKVVIGLLVFSIIVTVFKKIVDQKQAK